MAVAFNRMNGYCREPLTSSKTHTFVPENFDGCCGAWFAPVAVRPRILT